MAFKDIGLKKKLLVSYSLVLIITIFFSSILIYGIIKKQILTSIEKELTVSTSVIKNMIESSVDHSITNYLRAISEKNRDIVAYFYRQYQDGKMSEESAKTTAVNIISSQQIGKTGYIFVWDIKNAPETIILKAHPVLQGENVAHVDFVQIGAKLKTGYLSYKWKNPDEAVEKDKAMYLSYFEPWNWVIAVSSYREEFLSLINIADFRDKILSLKISEKGYLYVIDSQGNIIVHPQIEGNFFDEKDTKGNPFIKEICARKKGKLTYSWKNPGEKNERKKLVIFDYLPDYDWIITASTYYDDFYKPLFHIRNSILLVIVFALLLMIIMTSWFGSLMVKPLIRLQSSFQKGSEGDFSMRLTVDRRDEIGMLTNYYNFFMERLERYDRNLKQEISGRIKTEEEIKETWNYLNVFINAITSPLIAVNAECLILKWNEAARHCCPEEEALTRKKLWEAFPFLENHRPQIEKALNEQCYTEISRNFIELMKAIVKISIYPFKYNGENGAVLRIDDITENEKKEEQLRQAQKMETVGNLAGGLAHDFNNVLGGIVGTISLLNYSFESKGLDPDYVKSSLQTIDLSAKRAADMVQQLLTLSRKRAMKFAPVDLNTSVENALKICLNTIDKSVEIKVKYAEEPAMINADPTQIEQVILNLCVNAAHSMTLMRKAGERQGGPLGIDIQSLSADRFFCETHPYAEQNVAYWILKVMDSGVGMDHFTKEKIFDPFFSTKEKGQGSGLGLAMVYTIIKQHKGFIDVYSEKGKGSTFNIFLQRINSPSSLKTDKQTERILEKGEGLILVIDDEPIIRDMAKKILQECGYEVLLAANGAEGVEVFKQHKEKIKCVILDMAMPVMSGREAFIALKGINPVVKILLASGFRQDVRVQEVLDLGVKDFIQKPYSLIDLSQKVKKTITS